MKKRLFTIVILITILTGFMISCETSPVVYQVALKDGEFEITQEQVIENNEFIFPVDKEPVKQGYSFVGWSVDDGNNTYPSGEKINITHDVIFYSQWKYIPEAPTGISKTDQSEIGLSDGTLVGVKSTQEYQVNGFGEWIAITESPVTGLLPGSYTVREKANDNQTSGTPTDAFIIDEVAVSDIVLDPDELVLVSNGELKTITGNITPSNASDQTIIWKSNDTDIVTVDCGEITSLAAGSTFITATAGDKVVTIQVTVKEETTPSNFEFESSTGTITGYNQDNYGSDIVIPIKINNINVQAIADLAFYFCGFKSVYIPNSVTSIGDRAFQYNSFETVTIPSSVTTLGSDAFMNNGPNQNSDSISTWEDFTGAWVLSGFTWYKSN